LKICFGIGNGAWICPAKNARPQSSCEANNPSDVVAEKIEKVVATGTLFDRCESVIAEPGRQK